jgi:hypothetical protein
LRYQQQFIQRQEWGSSFHHHVPVNQGCLHGKRMVQSPLTANSAYPSGLLGILGILTLAKLLCLHNGINSAGVTLACDGLSALQQSFYNEAAVITRLDFDFIHMIRYHLKVSRLKWTSWHAKGHQEDIKEWAELTWLEKQNV